MYRHEDGRVVAVGAQYHDMVATGGGGHWNVSVPAGARVAEVLHAVGVPAGSATDSSGMMRLRVWRSEPADPGAKHWETVEDMWPGQTLRDAIPLWCRQEDFRNVHVQVMMAAAATEGVPVYVAAGASRQGHGGGHVPDHAVCTIVGCIPVPRCLAVGPGARSRAVVDDAMTALTRVRGDVIVCTMDGSLLARRGHDKVVCHGRATVWEDIRLGLLVSAFDGETSGHASVAEAVRLRPGSLAVGIGAQGDRGATVMDWERPRGRLPEVHYRLP